MKDFKELREALEAMCRTVRMHDCAWTHEIGEVNEWGTQCWEIHGELVTELATAYGETTAAFIAAANPATIRSLLAELDEARRDADIAIGMLAEWCVAVDVNGTGWDDWDEHYKNAAYRPGPLRERLDAAIDAMKEQQP